TLIGEVVRPGNYELSSLSTLMNALYASGGPNKIGSFRQIELVRNGKNLTTFDLYDFLLKSDLTKNLLLQDGDVIRVSPYTARIALKGAIKKPALF
ncbi:SLBB domain-containing protein, partial [Acinetobacter baumannii]